MTVETIAIRVSGEIRHVDADLWRSLYGHADVPPDFEGNGSTYTPDYYYTRVSRWQRFWRRERPRKIDLSAAHHLHDYAYHTGGTWADRYLADTMYAINLMLILRAHGVSHSEAAAWAQTRHNVLRRVGGPWFAYRDESEEVMI